MTTEVNLSSLNTGLKNGSVGYNIKRSVFSSIENHIIGFQELNSFKNHQKSAPDYEFVTNEYNGKNGAKRKARELQIAFLKKSFKLVNRVYTNDRIQIVKLNLLKNNIDIIVINCHIPQSIQKQKYLLKTLELLIVKLNKLGCPTLVCGDFNTSIVNVELIGTTFVKNQKPTTPGGKIIDFISFIENDFTSSEMKVDSSDGYTEGNHYIISATLTTKSTISTTKNEESLDDIYKECEIKSFECFKSSKVINNYRNDKCKLFQELSPIKETRNGELYLEKFFNSYPNTYSLRVIYDKNLKGKMCFKTFKRFVENKGHPSREKTIQLSTEAIKSFYGY